MKLFKKIMVWVLAIVFTIGSNGTYMYFKFIVGENAKAEDTAKAQPSAAPTATPLPENLVSDSYGGIRFEYPKEWRKRENDNGGVYYYAAENTFMMMNKSETKETLNDSYFSDVIIDGLKKNQENFLEISRERLQNKSGVKYFMVKYNQTINKETYLCSLAVMKINSTLYIIGFNQPVSNSVNYAAEFTDVVNSIQY